MSDKNVVMTYIHNEILFSYKKWYPNLYKVKWKWNEFATASVNLEGAILSEISQAEKDKYCMISYGIYKQITKSSS